MAKAKHIRYNGKLPKPSTVAVIVFFFFCFCHRRQRCRHRHRLMSAVYANIYILSNWPACLHK